MSEAPAPQLKSRSRDHVETPPAGDGEWLARVRDGDDVACRQLYSRVEREVLPIVRLPKSVDRDEMVTDTVSALWEALSRLRDEQKLISYATTIARRLASKKLAEKKHFDSLDSESVAPEVTSRRDPSFSNLEREELVHSLTGALRSADRKLFRLLYVSGASSSDVRRELSVDARQLRKKKFLLRQRLKKMSRRYVAEGAEFPSE